jgi:hypothetical protein
MMVGVETDTEAVMPDFTFDESVGIEENLEAFFTHLAGYDKEFATHLKAKLPTVVGDGFNRTAFNKGIVEMLENESGSESKQA